MLTWFPVVKIAMAVDFSDSGNHLAISNEPQGINTPYTKPELTLEIKRQENSELHNHFHNHSFPNHHFTIIQICALRIFVVITPNFTESKILKFTMIHEILFL